jgi:hypothetical protein
MRHLNGNQALWLSWFRNMQRHRRLRPPRVEDTLTGSGVREGYIPNAKPGLQVLIRDSHFACRRFGGEEKGRIDTLGVE